MKNIYRLSILCFIVGTMGCSQSGSKENVNDVLGAWKAQWVTNPASYPDVKASTNFTMNGEFVFEESGKLTINAYGYEDCIFSSDTLSHSLNWELKNGELNLINENDIHGMSYQVKEQGSDKIKLQLMDDIFLHLTRN